MTTQDENTGLKPASVTTPDPPVVDASADITGLDKRSEVGDDSNLSLSKSKSTVCMGDDAVVELPPTAEPPTSEPLTSEPPTEGRGDATDILSPNKSNSAVAAEDDVIIDLLLTTEPPVTKLDGDDDTLPLNKSNSAVAAKDDVVIEPLLTTEPLATKHNRDDNTRLPNKKSKLLDQQTGDEDCKSPSITELHPPLVNDFNDFTRYSECSRFDEAGERISICTSVMMIDLDNHAA